MRKSISVNNCNVINTLNNSINASELIEVAVLYYLGTVSREYVESYKALQEVSFQLKRGRKNE